MAFQLIDTQFLSLIGNEILFNQLGDLVDIAIYECEKYYPAFQLIVLFENCSKPEDALKLCAIDTNRQLPNSFTFLSYILFTNYE